MVKRTTISIPDALYEKMDKWRNSINFSKEFQKHIKKLIEQKEKILKLEGGDKEMATIIERLREEKMEGIGDYRAIGYEDGFQWCKDAHYSEIQDILAWDSTDLDEFYPENEGLKDLLMEDFTNMIEVDEFMDSQSWHEGSYDEHIDNWMTGWKEGVEAFWNKVKDKIQQ